MKRILFILAMLLIATSSIQAQDTTVCPIPCYKEAFPYYFCDPTGARHVLCSTDPTHPPVPGYTVVLTHMPGCVNVIPIDTSMDYQPTQDVPVENCGSEPFPGPLFPPDKQDIWDRYVNSGFTQYGYNYHIPPWFRTYDNHPEDWDYDESEYQAALDQFSLDSSNFFNDLDTAHYDQSGYDDNAITSSNWYFNTDYGWLNEEYTHEEDSVENDAQEEATWVTCDSTFRAQNATGTNVHYEQVWNNAQASQDAYDGLTAWEALCHITGDPNCCIQIEPDNNANDWLGNYDPTQGHRSFALGITPGLGGYCSDGASCPDTSWRKIKYNATNKFFYQNNNDEDLHDPTYILHPSPFEGWFTGTSAPNGTDTMAEYADKDFSFRQMIWHEIGHFLGLSHPDQLAENGDTCSNNVTKCQGTQLMTSGPRMPPQPGIDPIGIQPDDACEFQKLYCPGTGFDGVSASPQQPEPPSPEIFPNPTTGACQLQYEVLIVPSFK